MTELSGARSPSPTWQLPEDKRERECEILRGDRIHFQNSNLEVRGGIREILCLEKNQFSIISSHEIMMSQHEVSSIKFDESAQK